MNLYVRHRPQGVWINFVHSVQDLRDFIEIYIPGRPILIGDLSTFNKSMKNLLLKFVEDNPLIDCYSSSDITDPVLLSRFPNIVKEPLSIDSTHDEESFSSSDKSYLSSVQLLDGFSVRAKLLAPSTPSSLFSLLKLL